MLDGVHAADIPAELSLSVGAFLCNQVTYELLHYLTTHQLDIPAGFVLLPALPEQVTNAYPPMPSMALETTVRGIGAVKVIAASGLSFALAAEGRKPATARVAVQPSVALL